MSAYDDLIMQIEGLDPSQIAGAELELTVRVPKGHDFKVGEDRLDGVRVLSVSEAEDGTDEIRMLIPGRVTGS
jgi:hypothetical protein